MNSIPDFFVQRKVILELKIYIFSDYFPGKSELKVPKKSKQGRLIRIRIYFLVKTLWELDTICVYFILAYRGYLRKHAISFCQTIIQRKLTSKLWFTWGQNHGVDAGHEEDDWLRKQARISTDFWLKHSLLSCVSFPICLCVDAVQWRKLSRPSRVGQYQCSVEGVSAFVSV